MSSKKRNKREKRKHSKSTNSARHRDADKQRSQPKPALCLHGNNLEWKSERREIRNAKKTLICWSSFEKKAQDQTPAKKKAEGDKTRYQRRR
jgi:hypothetical protein